MGNLWAITFFEGSFTHNSVVSGLYGDSFLYVVLMLHSIYAISYESES